jgi:hypothetical protein
LDSKQFPIQSRRDGIRKIKEIKGLYGDIQYSTSHNQSRRLIRQRRIDAEIAEKGHFWMETN